MFTLIRVRRVAARSLPCATVVETLKRLILASPASGIPLTDLISKAASEGSVASSSLPKDKDESVDTTAALKSVERLFLLADKRTRVVPCDWNTVMKAVAADLPPEGVLEASFIRHVKSHCDAFSGTESLLASDDGGGSPSIRVWVKTNFSHIFNVSPSRANPSLFIYRSVKPVAGLSSFLCNASGSEVDQLARSFQYLRRESLPVYTTATEINAASGGSLNGLWAKLAQLPDVQRCFDVDVDIVLRPKSSCQTATLFVDGSSVSGEDVTVALARLGLQFIVTSRCVLRHASNTPHPNHSVSSTTTTTTTSQQHRSAAVSEDVIVSSALDISHELCASILASKPSTSQIIVVCGDEQLEVITEVLSETCFLTERVKVVVATPTQSVQVR